MEEEKEPIVETTKEKPGRAKTASLIAKIFSAVFVVVCSCLKWKGVFPNCDIADVCMVAGTVAGLFLTVDANIAIDKFKKK